MTEQLLRTLTPQVLAILIRRHGQFDLCEDAVQEALLAATTQWPRQGIPDNPRAWLLTVATRRLTDHWRSEAARRRREDTVMTADPTDHPDVPQQDDTLTLLFLCCHPELSAPSQIALTLRAVGGLTTAEIAGAFGVPEPTMAQRISRAKQTVMKAGSFERKEGTQLPAVLHVLYLIFNEGYTATSGATLNRTDLTAEAIRLTRQVHAIRPDDGEVTGLLALMLLTDARRDARTGPDGELIPLDEQDRTNWDAAAIHEGTRLLETALTTTTPGPYQLQAAIAAVHDEAPSHPDTDWAQIVGLYELLERYGANPAVQLSHAVAIAMVHGPAAGLRKLDAIEARTHRVDAVRGHLLERAGRHEEATHAYERAAKATTSLPEQRYLMKKAAALR